VSIFFDSRWLGPHGIGRFAREVSARCGMRPIQLAGRPVDPFDPFRLGRYLSSLKPEHFFTPGFNAPLGRPCPFSLTIHDLIHLDVPEGRSLARLAYYQWVVKPALANAGVVFTGSEHARQRLVEWSGLPVERFVVTGHGVCPEFSPDGPLWANDRPYLLYVGNQKPHKNVVGLVRAFAASGLASDFDLRLTGVLTASVALAVANAGAARSVRGLGLIPETELAALYRGAHALIMPSQYEGFGLPVLEAMACGTPVLSSNKTSLPEVGGEAVLYFDPDDQDSFVEGLRELRNTRLLSELRVLGLTRAQLFNWDNVAASVAKEIGLVCR
jgi:glycosyltransferase involved in cell wall biosynthesis